MDSTAAAEALRGGTVIVLTGASCSVEVRAGGVNRRDK